MHLIATCLFLSILCSGFSAELPSSFKKCSRDRNFQKCLVEAVDDALHQLDQPFNEVGLPSIDPLEVPSLTIGAGSSAANFEQKYHNMTVTGFTKGKVSKFDVDFDKQTIDFQVSFPQIVMAFTYDFEGKVLVLPFYGKGPGVMTIDNMNFDFTFNLEERVKKGDKYYKIVRSTLKLTPERIHFKLDNLFGGDEQLGKNINQVFNDNWDVLFADVKSSYEDAFGQIFTSIFDRLVEKVPVTKLFPKN